VPVGVFGSPDAIEKASQRKVDCLARSGCETRLEVTLRLAPELALQTQAPQRQQQIRIPRVLAQPLLRALEPLERVLIYAVSVKHD